MAAKIILYQYKGVVTRIKDGDTIRCMVSLGFDEYRELTIRLAKINSPEIKTPEGIASAAALSDLILGKTIYFNSKQYDTYGRSIAEIYLNIKDAKSINTIMVESGHAVVKKY